MISKNVTKALAAALLGFLLIPFSGTAQVTINHNQVYQPGTEIKFGIDGPYHNGNFVDLIWLDSLAGGSNAQWDFSNLTSSHTMEMSITSPSTQPQPLPFPADAVLVFDQGVSGTGYIKHDTDSLALQGFLNQKGIEIPRVPAEVLIKFPAGIGQVQNGSYLSEFTFYVGQDIMTGYIVDSVRRYNTTTYSYLFDAWGTLQTPNDQFDVLRQRVVKTTVFLADFLNRSTGQWVMKADSGYSEVTEYHFWSPDAQVPVLILQDNGNWGFASEIQWIDSMKAPGGISLTEAELLKLQVYPNPAKDIVHINVPEKGRLYVSDMSGRTLLTQWLVAPNDQVNLSSLPEGIYLLVVDAGSTLYSTRLIKK